VEEVSDLALSFSLLLLPLYREWLYFANLSQFNSKVGLLGIGVNQGFDSVRAG